MNRNGIVAVLVLLLIFAGGSDASLIGRFRTLVGIEQTENSTLTEITPSPSPISTLGLDNKSSNESSQTSSPQLSDNSTKAEEKVKPPVQNTKDESQPAGSQNGKCDISNRCTDQKKLIACLQHPENGSQELFLLVENEGESPLKVNVTVPPTINIALKELEIPKHEAKKISFSFSIESAKIVLNAGNGDCVLHLGPPQSDDNIIQQLFSHASQLSFTPIYGAYILLLTALIVGGVCACCKLGRKRRQQGDGVPYQELEMAMPETVSGVNVDTTDGWDQGWDDDWDEEKAVKPEVGHNAGHVSENGITSRSSNRDGWENDWDD
ncbi:hypothetical protein NE237_008377 [Protea cynaroides]|uniref:DUF7356 domain-containing protein n=1 Tax=Protea cynaroides TaxID=273540 RepID=A0A9Q0KVR5_9MAGN|nr:hypothetical protein NE237_008377 [Protea cynaroides]